MYLHRKLRLLAAPLIIAGLLGIVPLGYFSLKNKVLAQNPTPVVHPVLRPDAITGHPSQLAIPSLKINLAVINGYYERSSGVWTLTLNKAQYATVTVPPNNEAGNTLIYGHYRPEVFAYLHLIQPGSKAIVTTDNGYQFTYTFQRSEAFDPTDTSIFAYKGAPRLTLQTCSGSFFQHRQMYFFKLDGYKKVGIR